MRIMKQFVKNSLFVFLLMMPLVLQAQEKKWWQGGEDV